MYFFLLQYCSMVDWVGSWVCVLNISGVAAAAQTVLFTNARDACSHSKISPRCGARRCSHSRARGRCTRGLESSARAAEDAVDAPELIGVAVDATVRLSHFCGCGSILMLMAMVGDGCVVGVLCG
jgi:hypothetical protein